VLGGNPMKNPSEIAKETAEKIYKDVTSAITKDWGYENIFARVPDTLYKHSPFVDATTKIIQSAIGSALTQERAEKEELVKRAKELEAALKKIQEYNGLAHWRIIDSIIAKALRE